MTNKTKTYNKLSKNLTDVKKADKGDMIFKIVNEWFLEINNNHDDFKEVFISDEMDKKFQTLKEQIGDFMNIKEMKVIDFMPNIIVEDYTKDKIFKRLNKRFIKEKTKFYKEYNKTKNDK